MYSEYGGFADKRIKNLQKSSTFIVDDRSPRDIGADKRLFSYFCMIFTDVISEIQVKVRLIGNVPISPNVTLWIKSKKTEFEGDIGNGTLSFVIDKGNEGILMELANSINAIIAPEAHRYEIPSYKYVCPRTVKSLRRLAIILSKAWST